MTWIGGIWIGFLWMPFTIEKPITLFIAGALYRLIYNEKFESKGRRNKMTETTAKKGMVRFKKF